MFVKHLLTSPVDLQDCPKYHIKKRETEREKMRALQNDEHKQVDKRRFRNKKGIKHKNYRVYFIYGCITIPE